MTLYQRIDLATSEPVGPPAPLPPALVGLADESLANLDWADEAVGFKGAGFWPVTVQAPADPELYSDELAENYVLNVPEKTISYGLVPLPLETVREAKLAAIRDRRWRAETGGFTHEGVYYRSDDVTQNKVTGALKLFDLRFLTTPEPPPLDWELTPGNFVTLAYADLIAFGSRLGAHAQACFTKSRALTEAAMAAETLEELVAIDIDAGWPS